MDDRGLKAQLRQANALGLSQAIIIGKEEVRTGSVILRAMGRGADTASAGEGHPSANRHRMMSKLGFRTM